MNKRYINIKRINEEDKISFIVCVIDVCKRCCDWIFFVLGCVGIVIFICVGIIMLN